MWLAASHGCPFLSLTPAQPWPNLPCVLSRQGRSASVFGSQGSAFRAVPPRRTFSGPVVPLDHPPQPAGQQAYHKGVGGRLNQFNVAIGRDPSRLAWALMSTK